MSETKRYFACEEMDHVDDDTGISWWVVADSIAHVMRILGATELGPCVKFEIVEISREEAASVRAHETDPPGIDNLAECPLGTALCSEY